MKKHIPYLAVVLILLIVVGFNRCSENTEPKVTVKTTIDSTVVDSLTERIQYLESLPPETTHVEVQVPSEPDTVYQDTSGATIREFTSMHTDSVITAFWTTGVEGFLRYQDFNYTLHHRPVIRETVTKYLTKYRTREITIERQLGGFLAFGGSIGVSPNQGFLYEGELRYQAKDGYSYHARYLRLPNGEAIMLGLTIPIRIKIPFL